MAATITIFPKAHKKFFDGTLDMDASATVVKCMILENTYTYDNTDEFVSDLSAHETDASVYSRQTLANKSVAAVGTTGCKFDADDVVFSALNAGSQNIRYAVLYNQTGGDDTTPTNDGLILIVNFGTDITPNGNDFTIQWNSSGIFTTA